MPNLIRVRESREINPWKLIFFHCGLWSISSEEINKVVVTCWVSDHRFRVVVNLRVHPMWGCGWGTHMSHCWPIDIGRGLPSEISLVVWHKGHRGLRLSTIEKGRVMRGRLVEGRGWFSPTIGGLGDKSSCWVWQISNWFWDDEIFHQNSNLPKILANKFYIRLRLDLNPWAFFVLLDDWIGRLLLGLRNCDFNLLIFSTFDHIDHDLRWGE